LFLTADKGEGWQPYVTEGRDHAAASAIKAIDSEMRHLIVFNGISLGRAVLVEVEESLLGVVIVIVHSRLM
jgi:hypothetical protein